MAKKQTNFQPCRIRVAVIQLCCHPAFAIQESDWLGEPFVESVGALQNLLANGFEQARDIRDEFRSVYLEWSRNRLDGVLNWLENVRFNSHQDLPDILVFPEGGIPREHLRVVRDFSLRTGCIVFAGSHSFEIGDNVSKEYRELGLIPNHPTGRPYKKIKEFSKKSQTKELRRVLKQNLPSLSVLPVFVNPMDRCIRTDDGLELTMRFRTKQRLSPMEATEIGGARGTESPRVLTLTLPSRAHRSQDEPNTIDVLPLVCAEALNLTHHPPDRPYQLAVVVSFNKDFRYFSPIVEHLVHQQIPVAYCNDGQFGNSTIAVLRDDRNAHTFHGEPYNGRLPVGDSILISDITLGANASQTGTSSPAQTSRLVSLSAVVRNDELDPSCFVAQQVKKTAKNVSRAATANMKELTRKLDRWRNSYSVSEIQKINLKHLSTLSHRPSNAYPLEWDVHANPCIVPRGAGDNQYATLLQLEQDLATRTYHECGNWFSTLNDSKGQKSVADRAAVLGATRAVCRKRVGPVVGRVLAELERNKTEARNAASDVVVRALGNVIERYNATFGALFLCSSTESCQDNSRQDKFTSTQSQLVAFLNVPRRLAEFIPKGGVVDRTLLSHEATLRNKIDDQNRNTSSPSTRSELAVPVFVPNTVGSDRPLIGVLHLASIHTANFLPAMVGEIELIAYSFAPELLILDAMAGEKMLTGWHPHVHTWGTEKILNQFCAAVTDANAKSTASSRITCAIWNWDRSKDVLYGRGISGFDFEYSRLALSTDSLTGRVVKDEKPVVKKLDVFSPSSDWQFFTRKGKIDSQGIAKLIITPMFKPRANSVSEKLKAVGALNLYFHRHDQAFGGTDSSRQFSDDVVRRLADLASQTVSDLYRLKERYSTAHLASRLLLESRAGLPPFEIIKRVVASAFEADGCSLFQHSIEKDQPFQCVASTGLSFHGIPVPNANASYSYEECNASEEPQNGNIYRGLTPYLLAEGGRILRMLNIADRSEYVSVITKPLASGLPPSLSDRKSVDRAQGEIDNAGALKILVDGASYMLRHQQHFIPLYRCAESIVPTDSFHHRFLGASFGTNEINGRKCCEGMIRLIRSMNARPFVRHDALLLGDFSRISAQYFRQWAQFDQLSNEIAGYFVDPDHQLHGLLDLLSSPKNLRKQADAKYFEDSIEKARIRLLINARNTANWNTAKIEGLLKDCLLVFSDARSCIAVIRLVQLGKEGEPTLRPFKVVSRWSNDPPSEDFQKGQSIRANNNGWKSILSGQPSLFNRDEGFTPIHRDSHGVKSGIVIPFRSFGFRHSIAGAFSLDFEMESQELRWKVEHLKLLVLTARQFAVLASSNRLNANTLDSNDEFKEVKDFVDFFKDRLRHYATDIELELIEFTLFDKRSNRNEKMSGGETVELCSVAMIEQRYRTCEPGPLTELLLHGVQWNEKGYFRFPLYVGSQIMGEVCGRSAAFVTSKDPDQGKKFDLVTIGSVCDFFGNITSEWNLVVNGNHVLSDYPLWSAEVKLHTKNGTEQSVEVAFEWQERFSQYVFSDD